MVIDDGLPVLSAPDSVLPEDDIPLVQTDGGTSEGEALSDAPTSVMSDFTLPEGKSYVLYVEGQR